MKKSMVIMCAVVCVFGVVAIAGAILIDNGDGTITEIRNYAAYSDNSTIMGLKNANPVGPMTWYQAMDWDSNPELLEYDDWILPVVNDFNEMWYIQE